MNPETSVSNQQIVAIFKHYGLADDPQIKRIEIGFTNEVHQVDDYILKIAVRKNWLHKFNNEVELYRKLDGKAKVPKLVVADSSLDLLDKPYMIYKMIPGKSLGSNWHKLTNAQRREITREFCEQLRIIAALEPNPGLPEGRSWQAEVLSKFNEDFQKIQIHKILPAATIHAAKDYLERNKHLLEEQKLSLFYWDLNPENLIVDQNYNLQGLIDFEHVSVVSLDFPMEIVRQMMNYPWMHQTYENEKYAKKEDYEHLMDWYREFYPEMFDFKDFEKRLDVYELEALLRRRPSFPHDKNSLDRIEKIISS